MGNTRTILGCILLAGCATTPPWERPGEEAASAAAPDVAASAESQAAEDEEDVTWEEGSLPEDSGEKQTDGDVSDSVEAAASPDDTGDENKDADTESNRGAESAADRAAREATEAAARSALRDIVKGWSARARAAEAEDDEHFEQLRRTYESYLESVVTNEGSLRLRMQVSLLARSLTKPHAERNLAHAMLRRLDAALANDKTPVAGLNPARIQADADATLDADTDKRAAARQAFHGDFDRDLKKSMPWDDARRQISLFRQK